MTGGRAIILGPVGRNFAAGMSGGIAYVYDPAGDLEHLCNREMVGLERVIDPEEAAYLHDMVAEHRDRTGSSLAASLLKVWPKTMEGFVRVMPHDYKKALEKKKLAAMEAR